MYSRVNNNLYRTTRCGLHSVVCFGHNKGLFMVCCCLPSPSQMDLISLAISCLSCFMCDMWGASGTDGLKAIWVVIKIYFRSPTTSIEWSSWFEQLRTQCKGPILANTCGYQGWKVNIIHNIWIRELLFAASNCVICSLVKHSSLMTSFHLPTPPRPLITTERSNIRNLYHNIRAFDYSLPRCNWRISVTICTHADSILTIAQGARGTLRKSRFPVV